MNKHGPGLRLPSAVSWDATKTLDVKHRAEMSILTKIIKNTPPSQPLIRERLSAKRAIERQIQLKIIKLT